MSTNYKIITADNTFAVIYTTAKVPFGWDLYTEQAFASKEAAQEWLWNELECWDAIGGAK